MALATYTTIKANYLNIETGTTTFDSILTTLIGAATAAITSYCGQPLEATTESIEFAGRLGTMYMLPYVGVPVSLTSLQHKSEYTDAAWTSDTGAVIVKAEGVQTIYYQNGFVQPLYKATMSVGYATADIPADIKHACSIMVVEMFKATDYSANENRLGLSTVSSNIGGMTTTTTFKDLTYKYRELLQPYKAYGWN